MKTPIIETERLILRPLTVEDANDIFERWTTDERVAKYVRWCVHDSVDMTKAWLQFVEENVSDDKSYDWGFALKENGYLIGSGGIFYKEEEDVWEIGYNFMYDYWNQGYATEAAKAMLQFGIDELNIKEFVAFHAKENPASGGVLGKCGFKYEKDEVHTKFDGVTKLDSKRLRLIVE